MGAILKGAVVAAVLSAGAAPALAEEWTPAAATGAEVYEIDLSTLSRKGDVAQSWMRQVLTKPQKDARSGKSYWIGFSERSDDCANHKFALNAYVMRDREGRVVSSGAAPTGWQSILPGSVADGLWKVACAVTAPPEEKALLTNIAEGDWRKIGPSADRKFNLNVRLDDVVKVQGDLVIAVTRSDYDQITPMDGLPIRFVVTANLVDCKGGKIASIGSDFYVTPTARVRAIRSDPKTIKLENIAPGSFASASVQQICAAGAQARAEGGKDEEEGGFASGTAWATNKGYLVTASHVITNGKKIEVYADGVRVGDAVVVVDDPANDLAILKFAKARRLVILPLAPRAATLGRSVFTLGYPEPDVLGQKVKMTAGQVSSTAGIQDDTRFLQISVPIQQGNSGGPVIGLDGTVVGVVDSKLTQFSDDPGAQPIRPENVNYAVKVSYVRPMLEELPDLGDYVPVKAGASADDLVQEARKAVFMLVVAK